MVIHIDQIRDAGYRVDEPLTAAQLDETLAAEGHDTGFRALGEGRLQATLRKLGGGVFLDGKVEVTLKAPCKRCLDDVKVPLATAFQINLVPEAKLPRGEEDDEEADAKGEGERAGSFDLEKADEEVFDGKNIDLDPIVREQVLLAVPMSAVCREDCQGLCPVCGKNRNETQCGCDVKPVDPRLAALKNIKLS
jgi:uncharacterized protein